MGFQGQARKLPCIGGTRRESVPAGQPSHTKETIMQWTKPEFTDLRFGFEITMYIFNR
jgi:coenzyme PQQ precursor peptide PqqA